MSHLHTTENLVFERFQQQQREQRHRQSRPLVESSTPRPGRSRRFVGTLGTFFISMGTKLQRVEQRGKSTI